MDSLKKFSPGFYGVIILCFFLPFVNLTCSGQKIMSLSGFQLITGTEINASGMLGDFSEKNVPSDKKEVDPQPLALFALISAIAGLGLSFVRKKMTALITVVISVIGFIFLILLKINLDGDVELSAQNVLSLDYQLGYWIAVLLFIGSAIVQWLVFKEE
ncbi:MAG: hypothetical protein RBR74_01290 [Ignavibacteriaceae bacterium]|jgi:hypothetical protein|nr:hypothetical protein [Ignavibacteriaceae bacterium]